MFVQKLLLNVPSDFTPNDPRLGPNEVPFSSGRGAKPTVAQPDECNPTNLRPVRCRPRKWHRYPWRLCSASCRTFVPGAPSPRV